MERRVIPSSMNTIFEYDYAVQAEDMRGLYEKAKRDQWNATRDIAWDAPEPDDGRTLADELVDIHGSPIWTKLSEKERVELEESVYLAGPDGPRRAMQIVIHGHARRTPHVHWAFAQAERPPGQRHDPENEPQLPL